MINFLGCRLKNGQFVACFDPLTDKKLHDGFEYENFRPVIDQIATLLSETVGVLARPNTRTYILMDDFSAALASLGIGENFGFSGGSEKQIALLAEFVVEAEIAGATHVVWIA